MGEQLSSVRRYVDDFEPEALEGVLAYLLACIDVTGHATRDDVRRGAIKALAEAEHVATLRLV